MATFLVSYDLKKPGQNYPKLITAVSAIGKRILLSAWIVDVAMTASQLRNYILQFLDANDDVIVIEIRPAPHYDWATYANTNNPGVALLQRLRP